MRRRLTRTPAAVAVAAIAIAIATEAAAQPEAPTIEIYTMDEGALLVEAFGHAAICVRWSRPRRDRCYNYGTTNFSDPVGLGWGFLRGRSNFWVSTMSPGAMLDHYEFYDRTIWVQPLPLHPDKAREVARLLQDNARPENRNYTYHHFRDNCSTRVGEFVDGAMEAALSRGPGPGIGLTFRDLMRQGLATETGLLMLSDILVGRSLDREPNSYERTFLPRYLRAEIDQRLGVPPERIYEREGPPFDQDPGWGGRQWFALAAILFSIPAAISFSRGRQRRSALALAMLPALLAMLLIWGMAVVSSIPEFRFNEALLVFLPTDVALLWLGPERRRLYARARIAMLALIALLLVVGLFLQPLWAPMLLVAIPLAIVAAARPLPPPPPPVPPEPPPETLPPPIEPESSPDEPPGDEPASDAPPPEEDPPAG